MSDSQSTESTTTASGPTENHPAQPTGASESTDASTTNEPTLPTAEDTTEDTTDSGAPSGETLGADTPGEASTTVKDPSEWVTGDEPMTGAQRSYLDTLARAAGEQLPADLNKAQASEHIDRLQAKTGRGAS